jgi:hypothetical protein
MTNSKEEKSDIDKKNEVERRIKISSFNRITELYIWLFIALLIAGRAIYFGFKLGTGTDFFLEFYNEILIAILVFLFPLIFKQIFNKLPFEFLRSKKMSEQEFKIEGSDNTIIINKKQSVISVENNLLAKYAKESKDISEKIYSRSGVYLLIGCLIAFTGVAIFYSPVFGQVKTEGKEISQILVEYLPRFGALFFIEFVALFFLKQYRIMMQEYRYYEKIKRDRQNSYSTTELIKENLDNQELIKIILKIVETTDSSGRRMSSNETTEILEIEKIAQKDLDIIGKFTDFVKELKK